MCDRMNRRDVLLAGLGAAAGALAAAATRAGHAQPPAGRGSDQPPAVESRCPGFDPRSLEPKGSWYEVEAPDTLDLAEHARLAINALTGHLEPEKHYAVYQSFTFDKEPKLGGLTWNLPAKDARVLPMLRAMTGSTQGLDIEWGLMDALLAQIGEDGLAYSPISDGGAPQGTAYPIANGLLALAILSWHERDGDPAWLDRFRRLTTALASIAIRVEDRAYWPPESSYRPDGTWAWTTRGAAKVPYQPPEEPYLEQQGTEGCVKYEQAAALRALIARYRLDGLRAVLRQYDRRPLLVLDRGSDSRPQRSGLRARTAPRRAGGLGGAGLEPARPGGPARRGLSLGDPRVAFPRRHHFRPRILPPVSGA